MVETRKFFRVLKVLYYAILEGGLAFIFWNILLAILYHHEALSTTSSLYKYAWYTYSMIVLLFIVRNAIHRLKWYVCAYPTKLRCTHCNSTLKLTRYGEYQYLNAPFTIYIPRKVQFFHFVSDKIPFYEMALRPYLQLDCPECGEKQVICPYCHKPIPQELVKCQYDKPSKCPHCGKKIYTPTPIRE